MIFHLRQLPGERTSTSSYLYYVYGLRGVPEAARLVFLARDNFLWVWKHGNGWTPVKTS
jgi:hypothetical protein